MGVAHKFHEKLRTTDVKILQNVTFDTMLLSPRTLEGLKNSGFHMPSPVQLHAIPMGKCGFDLMLEAKSGTGKTAVFAVIALEKINIKMGLQAIVLSPTREIAAQICDVLKQVGSAYKGLRVEVVMGGLPVQDDIEKFAKKNVHIVVGSPGRLKHLMHENHIDVSSVRLLVLDEADKLMEKSFLNDMKYIHSNLPKQKQVIMSSATYTETTKEFINQFVHGAQHIRPENSAVLVGVAQKVSYVQYNSNTVMQTKIRFQEVINILTNLTFKQCLIFCNLQTRVADLHRMLSKAEWPVAKLHGQQDQVDRLGALKTLQEYKCRILVSTDLASRGIDASNIDLVINFEPPYEWQTYLHRIGRAGRFGSYGTAITIASMGQEKDTFIDMFKSLNSNVSLSCLWTNNNEINDKTNQLGDSSECTSNFNNTYSRDTNDNYSSKIGESHHSAIKGAYDLLFPTCVSIVEIESLNDLIVSYEQYNLTEPKANYEYKCINLPILPIENTACSSKIISCKDDPSVTQELNLEGECLNKISSPHDYGMDLPSIKRVDLIDNENYPNMNFSKLGLPMEFSSSRNKNLNGYGTKNTVSEKEKPKGKYDKIIGRDDKIKGKYGKTMGKNSFSQKEPYTNNNFSRNSKTSQEKDLRCKNSIGNKTEITRRQNMRPANNSENNCCYSSDIYNNSYVKWYNHLKLKTKQLELALYINELSCVQ